MTSKSKDKSGRLLINLTDLTNEAFQASIPTLIQMVLSKKTFLISDFPEEMSMMNKCGLSITKIDSLPTQSGTNELLSSISSNGKKKDSIDLLLETTTTEKDISTIFPLNLKKNMHMLPTD